MVGTTRIFAMLFLQVRRSLMGFIARIGSCATCMRQSLQTAIVAWFLFALAAFYYPGTPFQSAMQVTASALSLLWLLHLAAYAARALNRSRTGDKQVTITIGSKALQNELGRRRALAILLRAAAIGAVVSLPLVLRPTAALAFCGQCSKNSDCGVSPCRCVNTAGPGLPVCNECKCD